MNLSNCCKKEMRRVYSGKGGEGSIYFYVCVECNKACDEFTENTNKDEKLGNHLKNIHEIALRFTKILNEYYPEIVSKTFNEYGYSYLKGVPATERIKICLYVELIKAGVFNDSV